MGSEVKPGCRPFLTSGSFWLLTGLLTLAAEPERFRIESAGARFGVPGNVSSVEFHAADAMVNWFLPPAWDLGRRYYLQTRLDVSAGWMGDAIENAFVGSVGGTLLLSHPAIPLTLEAGVSPTVITRWEFETKNLGIPFQLTSHFGLNAEMGRRFRLSYRYQHMSNCRLSEHNQGLNLHFLGISYRF